MNRTILAGRLGADPEVRFTSSGQKVTTLRLAVNQRRGGQDETMWWRVTVWGERFDKMMSFLKKGSALVAIGEMKKPHIYTNRDGQPQVSLELVATDLSFSPFGRSSDQPHSGEGEAKPYPAKEAAPAAAAAGTAPQSAENQPASFGGNDFSFSEEEIPF